MILVDAADLGTGRFDGGKFAVDTHTFFSDLLRGFRQPLCSKESLSLAVHPLDRSPNVCGSGEVQSVCAPTASLQQIFW